jgi:hypothetical protein
MSDAARLTHSNGNGGHPAGPGEAKEVPKVFTDAELDAREAELDKVLDRIDEVIPQARAEVQRQRRVPESRVFALNQMRRTRTAFVALQQAAADVVEPGTGRFLRSSLDDEDDD